jgi:hypothetical protein
MTLVAPYRPIACCQFILYYIGEIMINIKRNSPTHVALCYLKIRGHKWSTENDLMALSPTKYNKRLSSVMRSLDVLVRQQLAIKSDKGYTITKLGIQALHQIVKEQPQKQTAQ